MMKLVVLCASCLHAHMQGSFDSAESSRVGVTRGASRGGGHCFERKRQIIRDHGSCGRMYRDLRKPHCCRKATGPYRSTAATSPDAATSKTHSRLQRLSTLRLSPRGSTAS